jgi:hypothetical protein
MKLYQAVLALFIAVFASASAIAQDGVTASRYTVSGTPGFDDGGFYLSADFEFRNQVAHGFGGYAAFFQKKDSETDVVGQAGINAFGGFFRAHFNRANWELAVSPGFGIINIDPSKDGDASMSFGPSLQVELVTQITNSFAVGINWMNFYSWFNEKVEHETKETVGVRLRFSI